MPRGVCNLYFCFETVKFQTRLCLGSTKTIFIKTLCIDRIEIEFDATFNVQDMENGIFETPCFDTED